MKSPRPDARAMAARPHERRTAARAAITICLAVALTAGCAGTTASTNADPGSETEGTVKLNEKHASLEADDAPTIGGKLVVAVPAETNGWNPAINQWADAGSFEGSAIIEPLVTLDADGNAELYLAEKIDHNADFTQWDLTAKPGILFHDGSPLDANAMKRSIEAAYLYGLSKVSLAPMYDHIEVTGERSIRVFLKRRWAQYPSSLGSSGRMMAPSMLDREDKGTVFPIGTGPFKFEEWVQGKSLTAKRFDHYWRKDKAGRQLPYLDELEFRPLTDKDAMEKALQARDVDMALSTSAATATRLKDDYTELLDYTSERTFVMFNTIEGEQNAGNPFTNLHARKAVAYATDRSIIAGLVGDHVQMTTQGYRPDSRWGIPEDLTGYVSFDIEKAKLEVEQYKAETGRPSLSFTLIGLTSIEDSMLMQALQQQWAEAGIEAKIDAIDQVKYITTIAVGYFQAAWFRWYGAPNPDGNVGYNSSETSKPLGQLSINFTHYTSEKMDKNLTLQRESDDIPTRKKANDEIIKETNAAAINLWLFDTPYSIIASKKVRGLNSLRTHPFGNFTSKPWWGEYWIQS